VEKRDEPFEISFQVESTKTEALRMERIVFRKIALGGLPQ